MEKRVTSITLENDYGFEMTIFNEANSIAFNIDGDFSIEPEEVGKLTEAIEEIAKSCGPSE